MFKHGVVLSLSVTAIDSSLILLHEKQSWGYRGVERKQIQAPVGASSLSTCKTIMRISSQTSDSSKWTLQKKKKTIRKQPPHWQETDSSNVFGAQPTPAHTNYHELHVSMKRTYAYAVWSCTYKTRRAFCANVACMSTNHFLPLYFLLQIFLRCWSPPVPSSALAETAKGGRRRNWTIKWDPLNRPWARSQFLTGCGKSTA